MRSERARRALGLTMANYLGFVHRTNKLRLEPEQMAEEAAPHLPAIVAMWHGQHFMMPFARPKEWPDCRVMISRSADGDVNAIAASHLGLGLIRASGGRNPHQIRKRRGVRGFLEAMSALEEGAVVAMTADVPKGPARVAGDGIVLLASKSGRPVIPVAFATSRRIDLNSWDKATVNLPFGRSACVAGEAIYVDRELSDEGFEEARSRIEAGLNQATERAYAIVDGHDG
ncbi:lysophospholipid acyltransferase family protein [Amorphus sp. 3PC139-8]|uniref:lysophospholipid acyltransferase family protein n=1 Tax=Amorphus sp. 3PC139-8 TaxID=2735676 RepID=UPI00345DB462